MYTCNLLLAFWQRRMFQTTIKEFGKVSIVCNNAGVADEQNWKKMIAVNMVGWCGLSK